MSAGWGHMNLLQDMVGPTRRLSRVTRNGKLCLLHSGTRGVVRNGSHCSFLGADETDYVAREDRCACRYT
jgi:hypothetical protein